MTARLTLRLGLLAIVAFVLGLVAARWLLAPHLAPAPVTENATVFVPPRAIATLDLLDQDGRPFTAQSLRDGWTVVFFGFTHCPDVCPTTLTVMAQMKKQLADLPVAQQPHVMLFSVDPERDTPQRLREYVRFFDASFGAATGTLDGVQQAAAAFAVPFAKVPLPQGGYTMDHGAGVFFVAPDGAVHAYSSPPLRAESLARDFRQVAQYYEETRG
ncbi:MAG TPA: SCO family protein [Steroidobacteraceae bacterium]|nr:SCO family protein [Steroidobacteraceae bacterium]